MGLIQEGGVLTQKVNVALGITAILVLGAFACCVFADDSSADVSVNVTPSSDFCGVSKTITCTLRGDQVYYYTATLLNSSGASYGTVSPSSGDLDSSYTRDVTLSSLSAAGDYTLVVKFFDKDDHETQVAEKRVPIKVVEAIELSFTLSNEGASQVEFEVYFKVNGQKMEDSSQTVTISAGGTKTVTYSYYARNAENTTYSLESDNEVIRSSVSGLGVERSYYSSDSDYTVITVVILIVLIVVLAIFIYVLRKPVVNKGKPKGRR